MHSNAIFSPPHDLVERERERETEREREREEISQANNFFISHDKREKKEQGKERRRREQLINYV